MATTPQTKNARTDDEQPDPAPRSRPNGQTPQQPLAQVPELAREAAVETTEAVGQIVRQSQDGALRTVRMWTEMMTGLNPLTLLGGAPREGEPRDAAVSSPMFWATSWAEGVFEMLGSGLATQRRYVDDLLATQRGYVDQVLGTQRQWVAQFLDAGATVAAATRAEVAR